MNRAILIIGVLCCSFSSFSQCDISTIEVSDSINRVTMSEPLLRWDSAQVYISINVFKQKKTGKIEAVNIVLTYVSKGEYIGFTPNELHIFCDEDKVIRKTATEKSSNSFNGKMSDLKDIKGANFIECWFQPTKGDVKLLVENKEVAAMFVRDYKTGAKL